MARYILVSLGVLCCVISISLPADAQLPRSKPSPDHQDRRADAKPALEADLARSKEARLVFAIQVVSSLADEARSYKDESLRAKVQARAADVLWNVDRERARTLFGRAWEAAEIIDKEGRRRNEEERRRFLSKRGGTGFIPAAPNLRAEVLRLASLHDRALAEGFLAKMEEENKRDEEESTTARRWDPTEPPEAIVKRLQLARQLLENGETEKALLFATPGLDRVTSQGIIFLVLLRQKNAGSADQIFASLLERTSNDAIADATAVSLLSCYVFTPSVLVTSTRNGLLMNPWTATLPPPQLSPALRAKFFFVGSQILLRPVDAPELELTSAGLAGTYFTIKRLLPLFEQNDPGMAVALQGRLNRLAQGTDEIIPTTHRDFVSAGFKSNEKKEDDSDNVLSQLDHASSTSERNHIYAMAAHAAAIKSDPKAREFADKIEDAELKKSVRNFIDFVLVSKALEKRDLEKALQLARTAELSHFQRAWAYSETAALSKFSAPDEAMELILEATKEAGRIAVTTPESAQAWVAIASRGGEVDPAGKWDRILDAIKPMNRASDYTGEENEISVGFQTGNDIIMMRFTAASSSLPALVGTLAEEDLYRAVDIARNITNESPRAIALLAAARSTFERRPIKNKR